MDADIENNVGAPRQTPAGDPLPGVVEQSFWVFRGPSSDDLAGLLVWGCDLLSPHRAALESWANTGGSIEFFIGGTVESHLGGEIPTDLVKRCADLGLSLSFDLYAENRPLNGPALTDPG